MRRLFATGKVGLFLDNYVPSLEKRKSGETKILTVTLRCQPFDSKLAGSIDIGLGEDSNVKPTLFKLTDSDPKPHLRRVNFDLSCPRQNLKIFASPDTDEARILFDQVRISGVYARTEKSVSGYALVLKASFGPVGREQQEYIHEWMLTQRFVTFEESEPNLDFELDSTDEENGEAEEVQTHDVQPMWGDDPEPPKPTPAQKAKDRKNVNRPLHSHQSKKKTAKKGRR